MHSSGTKIIGHASYWTKRATKAIAATDSKIKNQDVQQLRKIVCHWHFLESGQIDTGAGYPSDSVIRAIRQLEDYV